MLGMKTVSLNIFFDTDRVNRAGHSSARQIAAVSAGERQSPGLANGNFLSDTYCGTLLFHNGCHRQLLVQSAASVTCDLKAMTSFSAAAGKGY